MAVLALGGCNFDSSGKGAGSAGLGQGDTTTSDEGPSTEGSTAATLGEDDVTVTSTPLDSTATSEPDPGDTTDGGTTSAGACASECPMHWVCVPPDCINPDVDQPCGNPGECGPAAPYCGPDGQCHVGEPGDPCSEGGCAAPLVCGPGGVCHGGNEGDACTGPQHCGAAAPVCSPFSQCQDGGESDPCVSDGHCAAGMLCGPNAVCQDGSENDPCAGPEDCGPSAPYCPGNANECHDGSSGDPCQSNDQCEVILGCIERLGECGLF